MSLGFSTNEVEYDSVGAPVGSYRVMALSAELKDQSLEKPENPKILIVDYEALDGEFSGKQFKVWYNIHHTSGQTRNIARQDLKRIADATNSVIENPEDLEGKVFAVIVEKQKKNPQYTQIVKYLPEDHEEESFDAPA